MTVRHVGKRFSMWDDKLKAVVTKAKLLNEDIGDAEELLLDDDWANAEEHQAWLDSASVDDVTLWILQMGATLGVEDYDDSY
jgi:hypothetical protein